MNGMGCLGKFLGAELDCVFGECGLLAYFYVDGEKREFDLGVLNPKIVDIVNRVIHEPKFSENVDMLVDIYRLNLGTSCVPTYYAEQIVNKAIDITLGFMKGRNFQMRLR